MAVLSAATLEAALPASIVTAVAAAAAGLTNSATQVYVANKQRTAANTSPEAWLRPAGVEVVSGGLGRVGHRHRYELEIRKTDGTHADRVAWAEELATNLHGYRAPNVTGLYTTRVENVVIDAHEGEGPAAALRCELVYEED